MLSIMELTIGWIKHNKSLECNVDRIFGSKCSFCEESFSDKRLVRIYSKNFG